MGSGTVCPDTNGNFHCERKWHHWREMRRQGKRENRRRGCQGGWWHTVGGNGHAWQWQWQWQWRDLYCRYSHGPEKRERGGRGGKICVLVRASRHKETNRWRLDLFLHHLVSSSLWRSSVFGVSDWLRRSPLPHRSNYPSLPLSLSLSVLWLRGSCLIFVHCPCHPPCLAVRLLCGTGLSACGHHQIDPDVKDIGLQRRVGTKGLQSVR